MDRERNIINKQTGVVEISNLTVTYPQPGVRKEKIAIDNLNIEVQKGQVVGLLGPNGAGKTTLIKSILDLINIKNGKISIFGGDPASLATRRKMGYMPEIANYYWFLNPEETLRMFGRMAGMDERELSSRINYILGIVGLHSEKKQLIKNFSKGMQVRLNIAQALLHDPELFILDEPFSGLDPLGRIDIRNILKKLKEEGKTILLSSHELSEAELICDYLCIISSGRVLKYGPLQGLLEDKGENSLERYFLTIIGESDA